MRATKLLEVISVIIDGLDGNFDCQFTHDAVIVQTNNQSICKITALYVECDSESVFWFSKPSWKNDLYAELVNKNSEIKRVEKAVSDLLAAIQNIK